MEKIFREVEAEFKTVTFEEFIVKYLPYTVRDESVNREGVWNAARRKGYLSYCVVGYGSKTALHLVDLAETYRRATEEIAYRDAAFAAYIEKFLVMGYKYAHLDGGNRCDTFEQAFGISVDGEGIDLEKGSVKISKGDYRFLPVDGIAVNVSVEKDMTLKEVKKKHPELYKKLMEQKIHFWIYRDLTQDERGNFFRILNANVTLTAMELRNPTVSKVSMGIRENLNKQYKSLFIEAKVLTESDAKRFGFMEWILRCAYAYTRVRSGNPLPYLGQKSDLDNAYQTNSSVDSNYQTFEEFFSEELVPYVEIYKKHEEFLYTKNAWFDFVYVLTYMQTNRMKLMNTRGEKGRKDLIDAFNEWLIAMFAEETRYENIKNSLSGLFCDLFSKNANNVIKIRSTEIREKFIPLAIEKGIIVELAERRSATDHERAVMYKNAPENEEGIKLTGDGEKMTAGKLRGGSIQADHTGLAYSKGGKINVETDQLWTAEGNRKKGNKDSLEETAA